MSGFKPGGSGAGGVLPASLGAGDLLIGDGAGAWSANPIVPVVGAGGVGSVLWWDGMSRYRYSAAPADGDVMIWDATTNLWVPGPTPRSGSFEWANLSLLNGTSFPSSDTNNTASSNGSEALAISFQALYDSTFSDLYIRHTTPLGALGDVTYTIMVGGVATALAVVLATNAAQGFNIATQISVLAGQSVSLRAEAPAVLANIRVRANVAWREAA